MEWVEMTAKTIAGARERALEVLGVAEEDAEIEVLEEPRAGLFGLVRGEARVRARVRPTEVRPKIDRRRGRRPRRDGESDAVVPAMSDEVDTVAEETRGAPEGGGRRRRSTRSEPEGSRVTEDAVAGDADAVSSPASDGERSIEASDEETEMEEMSSSGEGVSPEDVGRAAVEFLDGLVGAFDVDAEVALRVDGSELDIEVSGSELGLLIGPGGRTLLAIQDLARVSAQRRLGDHETRLRVDISGYRERRREALERFARTVAQQVMETGRPRSLEPMPSADRKVIHDVLVGLEGVTSRSEGDDPDRRVVVLPQ